jgi:hypothetical protein
LRRGDVDPREGPPEDEPALVGDAQATLNAPDIRMRFH